MPKTYTIGHRPFIASVQAWLLKNLLGRSPSQTWPPRHKIG
jgi:hypothetical protein